MNPIQQAWLKVLQPVSYFVNEKLAKRSGLLGKIGRFFVIGPREFGYHPMNRLFIMANRRYMLAQAVMAHRYSVFKGMTHKGYHTMRPMRTIAFFPVILVFAGFFRFFFFKEENRMYQQENPDTLDYVMHRTGNRLQLPLNTLNQRLSAHYTEIATIYTAEMYKRYFTVADKIIEERKLCSEEEKKTKYAHPSYKYEAMPRVNIPDHYL